MTTDQILKQALALPNADRLKLAAALRNSVENDPKSIEESWNLEARRRLAEMESGKVKGLTREEMTKRVLARRPKKRGEAATS